MAVLLVLLSSSALCVAAKPPVVEKLDELTGVTITHSRTPLVLSPYTISKPSRDQDYVELGAIEVNRMGKLSYFLWLGVSDIAVLEVEERQPPEYESIALVLDDESLHLDFAGWTQAAIGAGEPVYKKFYRSSVDVYYPVTLEQIRKLASAESVKVRTQGAQPKEYKPLFQIARAKNDFVGFVRTVAE